MWTVNATLSQQLTQVVGRSFWGVNEGWNACWHGRSFHAMKGVAKTTMSIMIFQHAIPILLIPLLVLTTIVDFVEQNGLILQSPQIITSPVDLNLQIAKHHLLAAAHRRPQSGETALPGDSFFTNSGQSVHRLSPTLFCFLRAPFFRDFSRIRTNVQAALDRAWGPRGAALSQRCISTCCGMPITNWWYSSRVHHDAKKKNHP